MTHSSGNTRVGRPAADPAHVEARRRQITSAAYEMFAEKGYHETGIADIADRLGIGHGTFYRYFRNKRDIFDHVVDTVVGKIAAVVDDEDPTSSSNLQEYREQTERIGRKLFKLFREDENLSRILFYEAIGIDEELDEKIQEAFAVFGKFTEAYLENGKRKGFLAADLLANETALLINAMIFETMRHIVRLPASLQEVEMERWMRAILRLMFQGMAA